MSKLRKKSRKNKFIKLIIIFIPIAVTIIFPLKAMYYLKNINLKVEAIHNEKYNNTNNINATQIASNVNKNASTINNSMITASLNTNTTSANTTNSAKYYVDRIKEREQFMKNSIYSGIVSKILIPNSDMSNLPNKDGQPIKTAFLTFDDGPSPTVTPLILDILKQYDIPATFFILGSNLVKDEQNKTLLKRIYNDGHSIGYHSYSHRADILYPNNKLNIDNFISEIDKTDNLFKTILGKDFTTNILRLPGGYGSRVAQKDPNLTILNDYLKEKNLYSIDWNGLINDSIGKNLTPSQMLQAYKTTRLDDTYSIILLHDTYGKETTAQTLPLLIDFLKSEGFQFKAIR